MILSFTDWERMVPKNTIKSVTCSWGAHRGGKSLGSRAWSLNLKITLVVTVGCSGRVCPLSSGALSLTWVMYSLPWAKQQVYLSRCPEKVKTWVEPPWRDCSTMTVCDRVGSVLRTWLSCAEPWGRFPGLFLVLSTCKQIGSRILPRTCFSIYYHFFWLNNKTVVFNGLWMIYSKMTFY